MAARSCNNSHGVNKHRGTPPPLTPAHVKCTVLHPKASVFCKLSLQPEPGHHCEMLPWFSRVLSILHTSKDHVQQMIQKITLAGIRCALQHGVMKSCNYIWVVQQITFYQLAHNNEAVSLPSSTAFVMGGNESYGVSLHVNNSSELEPAHCYEAVSAPPSTAPASVSQSTSTPPPPIQHPSPASVNDKDSTLPNSSKCDDLGRNSRALIVLFVLLLALLLAMVTACVAFAVEMSRLKSEIIGLQQLMAVLGTRGQYATFPLDSCAALPPSSPSGHYWVRTPTGSAVLVYCDPSRSCGGVTGGWRRVAELDMTNSSQRCPSALRQRNDNNIRTCGTDPNVLCTSITFPVNFLSYSKVCGKIRAYQVGSTDSFGDLGPGGSHRSDDINTNYLEGVSLTHGSPRQHIWSFAAALDEVGTNHCLCINRDRASSATRPPAFVGDDYFCDTGSSGSFDFQTFYSDDPLWDGAGCGPLNDCCTFNNPPWFYKQLPQSTTDSIEMRVCRDQGTSNEDIAIEKLEMYVQ